MTTVPDLQSVERAIVEYLSVPTFPEIVERDLINEGLAVDEVREAFWRLTQRGVLRLTNDRHLALSDHPAD